MSRILLDQIFCVRLVQSLAHFLWEGTAIWALSEIGARGLRKRSAHFRYAWYLGCMILVAMCVPMTFWLLSESDDSLQQLVNQPLHANVAQPRRPGISTSGPDPFPQGGTGTATRGLIHLPREERWIQSSIPLTIAYALGVVWMLVRLVAAVHGGQRLRARSEPIDDPTVLAAIGRAVKAMHFAYNPAVAFCRAISVPAVVGAFQPLLVLPVTVATGLTIDQLEFVARHELAHIRRRDHIVNLVQRFLEAFLFFHPAVWKLSRRIRDERELCCDEEVLTSGCTGEAYAESLSSVAHLSFVQQQIAPLLLAATGEQPSQLRRRVLWLLSGANEQQVRLSRRSTALMGLTCTAAVLCLAMLAVRIVPASTISTAAERLNDLPSETRHPHFEESAAVIAQWSPLHRAIVLGTSQEIRMLLDNKADPNSRTRQGWTPLHFAACLNRTEVIRMLIDAGASVDTPNDDGNTPLMSALGFSPPLPVTDLPAESAVRELLEQHASVNTPNKQGMTPLHAAVLRGHLQSARELLQRGAVVNAPDGQKRTSLHYACNSADLPMIKLLVDYKANCTLTDDKGRSAIQHLAQTVREDEPTDVLRKASQILTRGGAALDFCSALVLGDEQAVKSMLQQDPSLANKLPPNTPYDWHPINWAVEGGDESICALLLGSPYNADPNVRASDGRTPLHRAAMHEDRLAIVQLLIKAGANASMGDKRGVTPVHVAAICRKTESLRLLLSANADPNATELAHRQTPLHKAVIWQEKRLPPPVAAGVEALIKAKANVNATDDQGRSALHYACALGRIDLVEALLAPPGIDVNIRDNSGATPLSLASSSAGADSALIQLLLDHGARPEPTPTKLSK